MSDLPAYEDTVPVDHKTSDLPAYEDTAPVDAKSSTLEKVGSAIKGIPSSLYGLGASGLSKAGEFISAPKDTLIGKDSAESLQKLKAGLAGLNSGAMMGAGDIVGGGLTALIGEATRPSDEKEAERRLVESTKKKKALTLDKIEKKIEDEKKNIDAGKPGLSLEKLQDLKKQYDDLQTLNVKKSSLLDDFYRGKEQYQADRKELANAQPGTYGGFQLLGGAISPAAKVAQGALAGKSLVQSALQGAGVRQGLASAAGSLSNAAKVGGSIGGAYGFGEGEGKLLGSDDDLYKTIDETAVGAGVGATLGGGAKVIGGTASSLVPKKLSGQLETAYDMGKLGKGIDQDSRLGIAAEHGKEALDKIKTTSDFYNNKINALETQAEELGVTVPNPTGQVQDLVDWLKNSTYNDKHKKIGELNNLIDEMPGETLTIKQARSVQEELNRIKKGIPDDNFSDPIGSVAKSVKNSMVAAMDDAGFAEYAPAKKSSGALMRAQNLAGLNKISDTDPTLKAISEQEAVGQILQNAGSDAGLAKANKIIKRVNMADPEAASDLQRLVDKQNAISKLKSGWKSIPAKVTNLAGQASKVMDDGIIFDKGMKMINDKNVTTQENLTNLSNQLEAGPGKPFASSLKKIAAESNPDRRSSLLSGLFQMAAFRKVMADILSKEDDTSNIPLK